MQEWDASGKPPRDYSTIERGELIEEIYRKDREIGRMREVVTSWHTLFRLAHAEGRARLAHLERPTEQTAAALYAAMSECEAYRQLCLNADRMIHFPDLSR